MTPKRQRCMSKFLSNSTRASRPRRQRTALMEGNSPKIPCHFFSLFYYRYFGGRTVSALIYDQEMYDQQDFSA